MIRPELGIRTLYELTIKCPTVTHPNDKLAIWEVCVPVPETSESMC